ncbi:MAG: GNAT family N-acetyltransferase [Betaproteobacteria bacterium]|nr:GNAT family N-acetyltransferase [Betaproteobacteria bacterium]
MSASTGERATGFDIRPAVSADVPQLLELIRGLAEYERLSHIVQCTESRLQEALFGAEPCVEALLACSRDGGAAAGFALFFHNYSTFLGRRGLYLEDLYVRPEFRGRGCGKALLVRLARLACERGCGRFEWSVLDWNISAQRFYEGLGALVLPDWRIVRLTGDALGRLAAQDA